MTLTPDQIAQGWRVHDGGPCPVPLESMPGVKWDDGMTAPIASKFSSEPHRYPARAWTWEGVNPAGRRIIAYLPDPAFPIPEPTPAFDPLSALASPDEGLAKALQALLISRSWMRHSTGCRVFAPEATEDGFNDDCTCGLSTVLRDFDEAFTTLLAVSQELAVRAKGEGIDG